MARDYAKMYSGRNRKSTGGRIPYVLVGLFLLILAAGMLYFVRHGSSAFLKDREERLRDRLHLSRNRPEARPPAEEATSPVAFDFYNTLPATASDTGRVSEDRIGSAVLQRDGAVLRSEKPTQSDSGQTAKESQKPQAHYVLQLGVFSDRKAAARTRLNFLLAGVDSIIVRETTEGGKVLFRIQQGSYLTEKGALAAGARFRRHGVAAVVRRVVDVDATVPI